MQQSKFIEKSLLLNHSNRWKEAEPWRIDSEDELARLKKSFLVEKECLTALNNNFECICSRETLLIGETIVMPKSRTHFPEIVESDEKELKFKLTHRGDTIESMCHGENKNHGALDLTPLPFLSDVRALAQQHRADKQIECIIYNLKLNKIIHLDIGVNNLCINKDGDLSLIDFGTAISPSGRKADGEECNDLSPSTHNGRVVESDHSAHAGWPVMLRNLNFIAENLVRETWTPELLKELKWNARTNDW